MPSRDRSRNMPRGFPPRRGRGNAKPRPKGIAPFLREPATAHPEAVGQTRATKAALRLRVRASHVAKIPLPGSLQQPFSRPRPDGQGQSCGTLQGDIRTTSAGTDPKVADKNPKQRPRRRTSRPNTRSTRLAHRGRCRRTAAEAAYHQPGPTRCLCC